MPTDTPTSMPTGTPTPRPHWTATPSPTPSPIVLSQGTGAGNAIALTFDCGSDRGNAPAILEFLLRHGIAATFGITGRWAELNPDLVRQMVAQGDQIINHTYDHRSFTGFSTNSGAMSTAEIAGELALADEVIRHITGSSTRPYYRSPYGDESAASLAAAAANGYSIDVRWSIDSLGWNGLSAARIEARVLGAAAPGSIVLMHVGAASQDAAALPHVVAALQARGFRFVTITDFLGAARTSGPTGPASAPSSYRAVDPTAVYFPGTGRGPLSEHVVILDPGHGGDDPGTCYPYTMLCYPPPIPGEKAVLTEQAVALDIALYHLLPRLHLLGADVYLTRTTLEQNPDLEQRLRLGNYVAQVRLARARALYVSVHLNGAVDPSADYSLALFDARHSSRLASTLDAGVAAALAPVPSGGDHAVETYPGHVLRHNLLAATIVEPAFLTNAYAVAVPVSTTRIITTTSGVALRRGLRLFNPTITVVAQRGPRSRQHTFTLRERFEGRVSLRGAITVARTAAISALLAGPAADNITIAAAAVQAPATTATIPPDLRYTIAVSGAISVTSAITIWEGEGPWLTLAHALTRRLNAGYDATAPRALSLSYPVQDREESIARGLLRGICAFFGMRVPAMAPRPRTAVMLDPVVPPG